MSKQRIVELKPGEADSETVNKMIEESGQFQGDSTLQGIVARKPEIFKGFQAFIGAALRGEDCEIEPHIKELMRLKSAEIHQCSYCGTVRIKDVREEVGPKEELIFDDIKNDELTSREALAVEFAKKMGGDPNHITDEFFEKLRKEFTDDEIVELVLTECVYKMGHTISNTLRVGTNEESEYPTNLTYPLEESRSKSDSSND